MRLAATKPLPVPSRANAEEQTKTNMKGTLKKVNGFDVILTGEVKTGKTNGKKYVAVQIITYPFKPIGKSKAQYGKPQWVRDELLKQNPAHPQQAL